MPRISAWRSTSARATATVGISTSRSLNKGDNLYIASIIALNADTGAYTWHYQATPGDEWDYDAIQQLVLADLDIQDARRQPIMQ
jgi:quinohemoprotein ethanol dehydrogenase